MTKPVAEMTQEEWQRHADGRARRRLKKVIQILERYDYTCEVCGLREETIGFFEFHHTDPTTKDREIGSMINSASAARVAEELEKCIMVCPNCHKKEHLKIGMRYAEIRSTK